MEAKAAPHKDALSSTFAANVSLPIHRWFRYSAGFSADWAHATIRAEAAQGRRRVLDPFAGSGTTLLEAELCNVESIGIEAHPFVSRIARAKLAWRADPDGLRELTAGILARARHIMGAPDGYPALIRKCFPDEALARLDAIKRAWLAVADGSATSELAWLCLAATLRECSPVGTAQWQYVLPNKSKARVLDPFNAYAARIASMAADMAARQHLPHGQPALLLQGDARLCEDVPDGWADLIITSPPYANNYDYADATRLEMSFFGEISSWGDLQETVRKYLVRSCTQHVAPLVDQTHGLLDDPALVPIRDELAAVCHALAGERANHGGKKPYHTMIAAYFKDLAQVWLSLRRVTSEESRVCVVIGDSAPYGVYVPVDVWMGKLAVAAGFHSFRFEKTRDRNTKWKNRKHAVPLHEGRLWVHG